MPVPSLTSAAPTAPPPVSVANVVAPAPAPAPPPSAPRVPNPVLRLDPALGLVVLEFRNRAGELRTIPNERELRAYRQAGVAPD